MGEHGSQRPSLRSNPLLQGPPDQLREQREREASQRPSVSAPSVSEEARQPPVPVRTGTGNPGLGACEKGRFLERPERSGAERREGS